MRFQALKNQIGVAQFAFESSFWFHRNLFPGGLSLRVSLIPWLSACGNPKHLQSTNFSSHSLHGWFSSYSEEGILSNNLSCLCDSTRWICKAEMFECCIASLHLNLLLSSSKLMFSEFKFLCFLLLWYLSMLFDTNPCSHSMHLNCKSLSSILFQMLSGLLCGFSCFFKADQTFTQFVTSLHLNLLTEPLTVVLLPSTFLDQLVCMDLNGTSEHYLIQISNCILHNWNLDQTLLISC